MSDRFSALPADCESRFALEALLKDEATDVFVVGENGEFLGAIADYDLLKQKLIDSGMSEPVLKVMSRSIPVVDANREVESLIGVFRESRNRYLPVVEDDRLIGVLHRSAVLRSLEKPLNPEPPALSGPTFLRIRGRRRVLR